MKVNEKMKMHEFLRTIDLAFSCFRHCESKENFDTLNSSPMLGVTNVNEIEQQGSRFYRRIMYFRVKEQLSKEGKYIVKCDGQSRNEVTFTLTSYGAKHIKRRVIYNDKEDTYKCECYYFPSFGFLCRHIFATMKHMHFTRILVSLLVSQWTMKAKECLAMNQEIAPRCKYICSEEKARFGHLTSLLADVAYLGSKEESLFKHANDILCFL